MRLGRNRFKLTTREEVWDEWDGELKIEQHKTVKEQASAKLALMKKWEDKGRNLAFLTDDESYNFQSLLQQKHYGKIVS